MAIRGAKSHIPDVQIAARRDGLSNTDSFIDEVSEEVRRDRLFGYIRRYGWIALLVVVLLVGGATFNEYRKASIRNAAEARGDAILTALSSDDSATRAEALGKIDATGATAPVIAMLLAAEAQVSEDPDTAATALKSIADDTSQPDLYRELAVLKLAILTAGDSNPEDRIASLQPLTTPGAPFRVLAEEQIALAEIESGDIEAALTRLRALLEDNDAGQGLRLRVRQLIVALGGDTDTAQG